MAYQEKTRSLKSDAIYKYREYQKEKIKLAEMLKNKTKGTDLQSIRIAQMEKDWLHAHQLYIDASSELL